MENEDKPAPDLASSKPTTPKSPKLKISTPAVNKPQVSKPQVEGINAFKVAKPVAQNPSLTAQEKMLLTEDLQPEPEKPSAFKLMPESVIKREAKKQSHAKEVILVLIILLALGFGGYQAYLWHLNKQGKTAIANDQAFANNSSGSQAANLITSPITDTNASNTPATSTPITEATSTPATSTPVAMTKQLKVTNTPTGYLNVRSLPSSSGKLITQIHPGETYTYTDKQNGWYQITLNDGTSGWISAQYIAVQ